MYNQWLQTRCCHCSTCYTTFPAPPRNYVYKHAAHFCPVPNLFSMCTTGFKPQLAPLCIIMYNFRYIIRITNLTDIIPYLKRFNTTPKNNSTRYTIEYNDVGEIMSTKRARLYFEKTDKSLLQEIYDYFEPDFKLFEYSIKEFIWKFMFNFLFINECQICNSFKEVIFYQVTS